MRCWVLSVEFLTGQHGARRVRLEVQIADQVSEPSPVILADARRRPGIHPNSLAKADPEMRIKWRPDSRRQGGLWQGGLRQGGRHCQQGQKLSYLTLPKASPANGFPAHAPL